MRGIKRAFIFSVFLLARSRASIINVTIDDFFGDPTNGQHIQYFPSTAWQRGNGCQPCTAKPSPPSNAWEGTWADATFNPNDTATNSAIGQIIVASAQFTGTAVYVNCILTGSFTSPDGNTDMTFFLDGDDQPAGVFQLAPNGDTSYRFNVPVFSKTDLPFGQHTVRLEAGHAGKKALVLLDSIVYTTDDGLGGADTTSSSAGSASTTTSASAPSQSTSDGKNKIGLIVGPIIAACIVVIGLVTVAFLYLRRRDGRTGNNYATVIYPFKDNSQVMSQMESSVESSVFTASEPPTSSVVVRVSRPRKEESGGQQRIVSSTDTRRQVRPLPSAPSWPDSLS